MSSTHCLRCNRPLKDAESIAIGLGPNCRMLQKQEGSRGPTRDLFGDSEHYHHVEQEVLVIIDMGGGGRSVTDDIENVLTDMAAEIKELPHKTSIYRDQLGIFDGVKLTPHGEFEQFYELNTKEKKTAIKKAKQKVKKWITQ